MEESNVNGIGSLTGNINFQEELTYLLEERGRVGCNFQELYDGAILMYINCKDEKMAQNFFNLSNEIEQRWKTCLRYGMIEEDGYTSKKRG